MVPDRLKIPLSVLFVMLPVILLGQDPVFSNFYASPLQINPAMAGIEGPPRINIGYRNQWPRSGSSYLTYQASYDQYFERLHGGVAVKIMNDRQGEGIFNAYNLDVMYAYHLKATRKLSVSGGLQAGMGQRSFDPRSLEFADMFNPVTGDQVTTRENINGYNKFYPDFSTGIFATYFDIYGGIAMQHIFSPLITDENDPTGKISRKYILQLGALIPVIQRGKGYQLMLLSPNLVFVQQARLQQINYGLDAIYKNILLGVWTRHDLSFNYGNIIFSLGYNAGNWRFRYSYDIKLSSPTVRLPNMGAHEISLIIVNDRRESREKRIKSGAIKSPKL
ncbi:MAG: PorP/SprF family type IX secretion system membrane protein [Bacteroidales bacterium]|nr:PorP/SprF family type IX secretion system membrane protein [Bacteroidales bacterium]